MLIVLQMSVFHDWIRMKVLELCVCEVFLLILDVEYALLHCNFCYQSYVQWSLGHRVKPNAFTDVWLKCLCRRACHSVLHFSRNLLLLSHFWKELITFYRNVQIVIYKCNIILIKIHSQPHTHSYLFSKVKVVKIIIKFHSKTRKSRAINLKAWERTLPLCEYCTCVLFKNPGRVRPLMLSFIIVMIKAHDNLP